MICALPSQSGDILFSMRILLSKKDLQLMTLIDIRLNTYKNVPNEISVWGKSKPVRLIDAMDIPIDLPIQLCMTHHVRLSS